MSTRKSAEYIGTKTTHVGMSRMEYFKTKGNKLIVVVFGGFEPWQTVVYRGKRVLDICPASADNEGVKYVTSREALGRHGYEVMGAFQPLFGEDVPKPVLDDSKAVRAVWQ